jgi:flagellar biosynthetic protein FlhB
VADDDSDRKFDPTPQRRERFRKEGRFARARDAGGIAAVAGALAALVGSREASSRAVELLFDRCFGGVADLERTSLAVAGAKAGATLLARTAPIAIAAAFGSAAIGLAQAGGNFDLDRLELKPDRLDPLPRLQQLFSPKHALFETALAITRVVIVGWVAYRAMADELPGLLALAAQPPAAALSTVVGVGTRLTLKTLGVLLVLGAADYAYNRFQIEQQMKMTLRELKDEMKQQDGDPHIKAKMRAKARQAAKKRGQTSLAEVAKADVVVTNPTHVAVALRYTDEDAAPMVVAKGHDEQALAIRAEARKHGIPILENRPLARALDAETAVGQPISGAHFAAVAQVLAFVFRLRGRGPRKAREARGTRRA